MLARNPPHSRRAALRAPYHRDGARRLAAKTAHLTRWAADVTPQNVHPEYPRPPWFASNG